MSKFVCLNKECKGYGKEEEFLSNEYKLVNGHLVSNHAECPFCGKIREEIDENADIPIGEKNFSIGEFASSSIDKKREILKMRSHEHFEKNIKESKEQKINDAVKAFKSANK